MFDSNSWAQRTPIRSVRLGRSFNNLKVRPKLMVLHNLFFLALTGAVYFSLLPLFERTIASAQAREVSLIAQVLTGQNVGLRLRDVSFYNFREGPPDTLRIPGHIITWLRQNSGQVFQELEHDDTIYWQGPGSSLYRSARVPVVIYRRAISQAKLTLFLVLGLIYLGAIATLEWVIMPSYVDRPLGLMLGADAATRRGDQEKEIIPDNQILPDEIGEIMRSRNSTIRQLRAQETELAKTLNRLEAANQDLRRKAELLESQDRLVSLGLLSASVAHELNTPLAVLHGSIEKLQETVPQPNAQERLTRMLRVTQRLRKISEGLLDFARVRRMETERVDMRALIEEAWSLVGIDEKASEVHFVNQVLEADAITGNPDRLMQVFVNLLRNALYAIKTSGTILVQSTQFNQLDRPLVRVTVDDDGPGIPPDVLPNLFEAFVTTRLDARGTGLGLTVAEGIIQQHGGSIRACNRPGGGARLEVILPAAAA